MPSIRNKSEKLRFAGVGAASTSIDFGILFLLTYLGFGSIVSNFISTTTAFGFSFTLNKKFTFKASGDVRKQIVLYFIITFTGLWLFQPVIIWSVENAMRSTITTEWLLLLVAKVLATTVTLVWNYYLYSRVVFPKAHESTS